MTTTGPTGRAITRADILDLAAYEAVRPERRKALIDIKRARRVALGPDATLYFESYETMWMQIHEMLRIEKGGEAQIADELRAYAPLVPGGHELVATVMFEIDDPDRRARMLGSLGGVESTFMIQFTDETVVGRPESDIERTNAAGKASSVHFLHFPFTANQIAKFRVAGTRVVVGSSHPNYGHLAVLSEATRAALAADFE